MQVLLSKELAISESETRKSSMQNLLPFIVTAFIAAGSTYAGATKVKTSGSDRERIPFNCGWLFSGSADDCAAAGIDESSFQHVVLPHTIALVPHADIDTSVYGRITWYRKHFVLPDIYRGRRISIEFQAVSKAAEVFCNGQRVGEHEGAYTPFTVDITDNVSFNSDNVLAVKVDSRQRTEIPPEGKDVDYMIGGGIVRDVALVVKNPVHVEWVYARRDPARVDCIELTAKIVNAGKTASAGSLRFMLTDAKGTAAASVNKSYTLAPGTVENIQTIAGPVKNLKLWHPDEPSLYTLNAQIFSGEKCLDEYRQQTGFRIVAFEKDDGIFLINGNPLKLRGLNRHETFPFIGRAAANRLQRRDAEIIKYDFGCNIVRCSHYPQDPEFLDRCDEIGLMVLEEMAGWNFVSVNKEWQKVALDNLTEMIIRDRNHPSVISFGVRVNQSADFRDFYTETNRIARTLAPDRPTHGVRVSGRGSKNGFLEDVWAQNFTIPSATPPQLPWITTESVGHNFPVHSRADQSRLIGQMLSHAAVHDSAGKNHKIAGLLGWCAFDYNSPYRYAKNNVCYHGVADIFRNPRHAAYFYRSQADAAIYGPMIYIAHYWEKYTGSNDIWVTSNCDSVELFVNKRSLGKHAGSEYRSLSHPLFVWRNVPYSAGEVEAVGYIGGREASKFIRRTPGLPVRLVIAPDDTVLYTGGDMTRIVVASVDSNAQVVVGDNSKVRIQVDGPVDFLGERQIALENGMTAFFIKTRSEEIGIVTCSAKNGIINSAKASIVVRGGTGEENSDDSPRKGG